MAPAHGTLPGPQLSTAQAAAKVSREQPEYWLKEGLRSQGITARGHSLLSSSGCRQRNILVTEDASTGG